MSKEKPKLYLDWCSHEAAKYACENWHYSKCVPVNKSVKIGVWEDDKFIGCVIYSPGASANLYKRYKLKPSEGCELTRVALTKHKTPVSKILALSLKFLKKSNPGLELVISFADTDQNHHGGIYQATNWIYTGKTTAKNLLFLVDGKWTHNRSVREKYGAKAFSEIKKRNIFPMKETSDKHRYLMPLKNKEKYEKLKKPYPKRVEHESNASNFQLEESGAVPTDTLQSKGAKNV